MSKRVRVEIVVLLVVEKELEEVVSCNRSPCSRISGGNYFVIIVFSFAFCCSLLLL